MAFAVALRLAYWWNAPPLGIDEASVALNLMVRPISGLFGPMGSLGVEVQVEPPGLALLQRGLGRYLGFGEHVLRLPSLVAALASVPLFYALARRVVDTRTRLVALLLFALCWRPIFFGAYVKQYSLELFFALLLWWGAVGWGARSRRFLGLAVLSLLFTYASIFVVGGIYLAEIVRRRDREIWRHCLLFGLATGLLYIFHLREAASDPHLQAFWSGNMLSGAASPLEWGVVRFSSFLDNPLSMGSVPLAGGALLFGVWWQYRSGAVDPRVLIGWLPLLLAASAVGRWPLSTRLLLFVVPVALLWVATPVGLLTRPDLKGVAAAVVLSVLAAPGAAYAVGQATARRPPDVRALSRMLAGPRERDVRVIANRQVNPQLLYYFRRSGSLRSTRVVPADTSALARLREAAHEGPFWVVTSTEYDPESGRRLQRLARRVGGEPGRTVEVQGVTARLYSRGSGP